MNPGTVAHIVKFFQCADVWSAGVTLYGLVVGRVPFHDENILPLYNKILTQPVQFPEEKDISPELQDLITRMLIKDPQERITLQEIKVRFFSVLEAGEMPFISFRFRIGFCWPFANAVCGLDIWRNLN